MREPSARESLTLPSCSLATRRQRLTCWREMATHTNSQLHTPTPSSAPQDPEPAGQGERVPPSLPNGRQQGHLFGIRTSLVRPLVQATTTTNHLGYLVTPGKQPGSRARRHSAPAGVAQQPVTRGRRPRRPHSSYWCREKLETLQLGGIRSRGLASALHTAE